MADRKVKCGTNETPTPHGLTSKRFLTHPCIARDFMQLYLPAKLQAVCDFSTL